ncbi:hypothetical protein AD998_05045 [bacterium 336/3]|jgi:hypothetical protein|nr:hypothetical protein AD998_05045 [bacterium 336/3]
MKKLFIFAVLLSISNNLIWAQKGDCSGYFAHKAGTKFEITVYDKKDKPSTTLKYEVLKNTSTTNGSDIVFSNESYDAKNRLIAKGEFSAKCQGSQFTTEVRNMSSEMMPKSTDIQMSVSGDQLIYPHKLSAGQTLPDASVDTQSTMNGMKIMSMSTKITNRKVEGFETVETPAGKFECVKISYTYSNKMTLGKIEGKAVEYLAKGVGLVKSESFDKNGKKVSTQLLTKIY